MENTKSAVLRSAPPVGAPRAKDIVAIGFRWRNRMIVAFLIATLGAVTSSFLLSRDYESEMKILVHRERVDPLDAPDQNAPPISRQEITEEELNSELELLKNDDVLHKVVLETDLQKTASEPLWMRLFGRQAGATEKEIKTAKAVRGLNSALNIKLPKKSNIIVVSYHAGEPKLAVRVLAAYAKYYLEKHAEVHRPVGQFEFFNQYASDYRRKLMEAEAQLVDFTRKGGVAVGQLEKEVAIQKLGELRLARQQTQMAIQECEKRIGTLEQQLASTPARMTTVVRTADNPELMMQVKAKLLELELKRTMLLQKFQPTYPAVQQVDQEIAETRAAIAAAEGAPLSDKTTDRDPTYEWMRSELAKARTEVESLKPRAISLEQSIRESEQRLRSLTESSLKQDDLVRKAKALEAQYLLYLRKSEEARISDALDQHRILNVSIAQVPSTPVLPRHSPTLIALGGMVVAVLMSVGIALASEWADKSFRTPDEVQWYLEIPVFASLGLGEPDGAGGVEIRR